MVKDSDKFTLMIIIVDLNEHFWSQIPDNPDSFTIKNFILTIISFSNAYLIENPLNHLCIIATSSSKNSVLFNSLDHFQFENLGLQLSMDYSNFQQLYKLKENVINNVKYMFERQSKTPKSYGSIFSAPLLQSLCLVNKVSKYLSILGQKLTSRVLIIKSQGDSPNQYVDLMNGIFAAQKLGVTIDACAIGSDSDLIHQATFLTGGKYFVIPNAESSKIAGLPSFSTGGNSTSKSHLFGLLEVLLWLFLPNPLIPDNHGQIDLAKPSTYSSRNIFKLPAEPNIEFRAVCFCHKQQKKYLDIGFVCSSCLAVFCSYLPICPMCNAHFKLPTAGNKQSK